MSARSRAIEAYRSRFRPIDLTPWASAAVGDTSDLDVPTGYVVMGDARSPRGPFRFVLRTTGRDGGTLLTQSAVTDPRGVLAALVDMAWVHQRETEGK